MRIFVSIAAYRDSETQDTIEDLMQNAARPQDINIGVCAQVLPEDTASCIPSVDYLGSVKTILVHALASRGPCWARHRILSRLLGNEDFVLQIDSHMRFEPRWDSRLVEIWESCGDPFALLSCYPVSYSPPRILSEKIIPILRPKSFGAEGVLLLDCNTVGYKQRPQKPILTNLIAAGFLFAPSAALREVPYDPHLYFHGEEITLAARLFTHGWNSYAPNDVVAYHNYNKSSRRHRHWEDQKHWAVQNRRAIQRVHCLLEERSEIALAPYCLGSRRTLQEFEQAIGVSFKERRIQARS